MKTPNRIRLVGWVVSSLILFVGLVSLPLARKEWTTAAMFPESENTFEFTNNETEDAYDLHIKWSRAVKVNGAEPFKKIVGSGKSSTDLSNGLVKKGGGKASVKVGWDGSDPEVKEWWWTRQNGGRLGDVKQGNPTTASAPVTPSSTTGNGLRIVTFDTLQGRVIVNLPDDMRAGDTILSTAKAEPKGQTPEERATNMAVLTGCVIEIEPPKKPDGTSNPKVTAQVTAALSPFTFTLPPSSPSTPPLTSVSSGSSGGLGITLTNTSGSFTIRGTTTIPIEIISLSLQSVAPLTVFQLPTIGQQGRPVVIRGPIQVNGGTTLMYGPPGASVQDFEKNTENLSSGFGHIQPLVKTPRACVFEGPNTFTGPVELYLKEGNVETTAPYRNVGIKLTADTLILPKGGSTVVKGVATGVGGSKPTPIRVDCTGQVDMGGGNTQILQAPPSSDPNATFVFNLPITATKGPGPFSVTATVVVFNVCLQDESNGNQLQFNSTTGDYHFCNLFPTVAAGDAGRINVSWYNTTTPATGAVTETGCSITLQHNSKDGRVKAQLDRCTQTGSATVQPASSKRTFTIIDKDTRNNTCACQ
jgi:hypothetical protein